jgi:A/G-specific adenine glycosylase
MPLDASAADRSEACSGLLGTLLEGKLERISSRDVGEVKHVFSHILMSYQIEHVVVGGQGEPRPRTTEAGAPRMAWLTSIEVEQANIGTGVKKIWAAVYPASGPGSQSKKRKAAAAVKEPSGPDGKRVLKVVMPGMPVRNGSQG